MDFRFGNIITYSDNMRQIVLTKSPVIKTSVHLHFKSGDLLEKKTTNFPFISRTSYVEFFVCNYSTVYMQNLKVVDCFLLHKYQLGDSKQYVIAR